ncbi:hypothetical protein JCM8547_006413 [Rhodosporidiobolus lusitaniae]
MASSVVVLNRAERLHVRAEAFRDDDEDLDADEPGGRSLLRLCDVEAFPNLQSLRLDIPQGGGFAEIAGFLRRAPHLHRVELHFQGPANSDQKPHDEVLNPWFSRRARDPEPPLPALRVLVIRGGGTGIGTGGAKQARHFSLASS